MLDELMRSLEQYHQEWVLHQEGKMVVEVMTKSIKPDSLKTAVQKQLQLQRNKVLKSDVFRYINWLRTFAAGHQLYVGLDDEFKPSPAANPVEAPRGGKPQVPRREGGREDAAKNSGRVGGKAETMTAPGEAETLLAAQVERWKDGIKVLVNQLQRQKTARGLMLENIVRVDDVLLDSGSDVTVVTPGILDALDEAGVVVGIVSHSVPIWRARMAATPSQPDNSSVPTNELSGMVNVKLLMAEKLNPPELDPDNGMECATPEVYPKTSVEVVEAELRRTKQGAIQAILTAKTAKAETRGLAPAEVT
ncbi:hypothetical protein DYB26_012551, partial [Aphanomyces astaci]